jgi:hypothetical protein
LVSASNLNFGTNGILSAVINQINVQCTNTTPYNIGLDSCVNGGSVTSCRMKGGPTNQLITYSLFSNAFRSVVGEPSAFASRQHCDRLCRRRSDCYAMDFHLLTDALQVLVVARHRA